MRRRAALNAMDIVVAIRQKERGTRVFERASSFIGVAVVATIGLVACGTTTQQGAVGVQRSQLLLVSSGDMNTGAIQAYQKVIGEAQTKGTLNRDPAQTARVRAIAQRLIPQTAVFRPDAPGWKWEVNVLAVDELNAWCMPGGKIAFYSGLIDKLRLTDDEIAAVMGHEIAHALREHSRERASQQAASAAVVGVGAAILGVGQVGTELGNMVAQATFNLPNSRTQESEADVMGVELAARAGYDPRAAIQLWQKMGQATGGGGGTPQWLSTHPSADTRIRDLQVYSQKVMPLYEQARGKR
jgi:predicted Zn-dependent protease